MNLNFATPSPLDYFASLVQSDADFPVLEAAASLAQDEEPALDVQQVLDDVARLLKRITARVPNDADDLTRLAILTQVFYKEMGFGVNANDYYAPENSYLNEVLRTRRGLPISLAVIWLELAQGLGLHAQGVSFPGHFLVKVTLQGGLVVLDPLTGESLGIDNLAERLGPYRSAEDKSSAADLDDGETPMGLYLQPCPSRDLLARMLRNLKEVFRSQQDWPRMLNVLDRLVVLLPAIWAERRDRGLVLAELGRKHEALQDLQMYLQAEPLAPDQDALRDRISELSST
ncbi:tetratricopeptide repeat protein [uncultured Limnohabitans sp.]|jgi:regulator of sirC expression with transglutaminase-like and TPR domain|uniref:SirB1 family protein n=1 Tax=uncultured Limnohabitans sp. TaxID=768543 RepID=UPI001B5B0F10|nr:tetratricopeptide repeat protein [uncultured Limnohabitans sp.]MBP6221599.1 tetratricopeptide repeat protein [Limnohabitans sp.]MBP6244696.1 tetratricopeptide repeat protein [Limnohabitans sp.]